MYYAIIVLMCMRIMCCYNVATVHLCCDACLALATAAAIAVAIAFDVFGIERNVRWLETKSNAESIHFFSPLYVFIFLIWMNDMKSNNFCCLLRLRFCLLLASLDNFYVVSDTAPPDKKNKSSRENIPQKNKKKKIKEQKIIFDRRFMCRIASA